MKTSESSPNLRRSPKASGVCILDGSWTISIPPSERCSRTSSFCSRNSEITFSINGGSAKIKSYFWLSAESHFWVFTVKIETHRLGIARRLRLVLIARAEIGSDSTKETLLTPRLIASKPTIPVPANRSQKVRPSIGPRILKSACLSLAEVGRALPAEKFTARPLR